MPANREGQRIPDARFRLNEDDVWSEVTTQELFAGKTIAAFALPGAFTPTCSTAHLPRFDELAPVFRANGIEQVLCFSVNDTYVMNAWQKALGVKYVRLIPDGNGDFADRMGMLVDMHHLGFGKRSWRYSMLVRDSVIEKMFIEPDKPGDPYEVSDADTLLRYINPRAKASEPITLFSRPGCPFCARARKLLEERGLPYEEIMIGDGITDRTLRAVSGTDRSPQIFIGGKLIGGSEELEKFLSG